LGTEATALSLRREVPEAYRALAALTRAGALADGVAELVKVRASLLNGCGYCVHQHRAVALRGGETEERLAGLRRWEESPAFDERERAALALTDAITLVADGPAVDDALLEGGRHFPPRELAALVVAIVAINAWNRMSLAAGLRAPAPDSPDCSKSASSPARSPTRALDHRLAPRSRVAPEDDRVPSSSRSSLARLPASQSR
jgi:AhpD family alkylhydroperoxidase